MTDEDILSRLMDGSLLVDPETCEVRSYGRPVCILHRESRGSSYRFVRVAKDGMQRKIALHRLVWMAVNRRLVPDGHDIHHKDPEADPLDASHNLEAVEIYWNRSKKVDEAPLPNGDPF